MSFCCTSYLNPHDEKCPAKNIEPAVVVSWRANSLEESLMFCPKCGATQSEELKFCKLCGANLFAVRQVIDARAAPETFDWSKTWVAQLFRSPQELKKR